MTTTKSIVADMARVMAERRASAGACTEDDLKAAGFTAAEIVSYADDARQMARTLLVAKAA